MLRKTFLLIATLLVSFSSAVIANDTLTVRIKAMRCEDCAHKVNKALMKSQGVESISFDLEKRTVTVEYDPAQTCADSICATLTATKRYKPSPYSKTEFIRRGMGLWVNEMTTDKEAELIKKSLYAFEGIDSIGPNVDKRYIFVRYDANKTTKAKIADLLMTLGFTPTTYYTSKIISYASFTLPAKAANKDTREVALALEGVDDANVNVAHKTLAITYVNTETSLEKLTAALRAEGIEVKQ
jgi:copper ion binding protein